MVISKIFDIEFWKRPADMALPVQQKIEFSNQK